MPDIFFRQANGLPAVLSVGATYKAGDPQPKGYTAYHEWADAQHKAGLRQSYCGRCSKWKWPQELSDETVECDGVDRKGNMHRTIAPVCKTCSETAEATK